MGEENRTQSTPKPNREYKDTVFRKLFSTKENALSLYNAINNTNYGEADRFTIETLDDAFFIDRRDDLAFSLNERLIVFCEMQSTANPNMPVRLLSYMVRTYERLFAARKFYDTKLQKIPAPEFYVLYVGVREWPVRQLRLSDAYLEPPRENSAELIVNVLDLGYNTLYKKPAKARSAEQQALLEILERSPVVKGYSLLNAYIYEGVRDGVTLSDAINGAIDRCFAEGHLTEFLKAERRKEVSEMMFRRLTMEEYGDIRAENAAEHAFADGREAGLAEGFVEGEKIGEQRGEKRGEQRGKEEGARLIKLENARRMKAKGYPPEEIAEICDLTLDEVKTV